MQQRHKEFEKTDEIRLSTYAYLITLHFLSAVSCFTRWQRKVTQLKIQCYFGTRVISFVRSFIKYSERSFMLVCITVRKYLRAC